MIVSSLQVGCLVLDEEHCLANGGDLACPEHYCLLQTGSKVETKSDDFGCSYSTDLDEYHLHLEYGLPAHFELDRFSKTLDTVEGILADLREGHEARDSCFLNSPELQDELDAIEDAHTDIYMIRSRFEEVYVGTRSARITMDEIIQVFDYNEAIAEWLEACLENTDQDDSSPSS